MKVHEILPESSRLGNENGFLIENRYIDLSDSNLVKIFLNELLYIQSLSIENKGYIWCFNFSKVLLSDLIKAKEKTNRKNDLIVLNYLHFVVSIAPLSYYSQIKNLNKAYDWAIYSLCDDLSDSQSKQIEMGRFYQFLSDPVVRSIYNPEYASVWVSSFYYMCRCLSACPKIASDLIGWSIKTCLQMSRAESLPAFTEAWSNMACWAANNQDESIVHLVSFMENMVDDKGSPSRVNSDFLLCLSTVVANYSSRKSWEWAKEALGKYSDQLGGHQKLQLLLSSIDWSKDDLNLYKKIILDEIVNIIRNNQIISNSNTLIFLKNTDRIVDIITPFIGACIKNGEEGFVYQVLMSWYGVTPSNAIKHKNKLLIFPNDVSTYRFISSNKGVVLDCDQGEELVCMMTVMNRFLGVSSSVRMRPTFQLHQPSPGRFGVPSESESTQFEEALTNFYHFDAMANNIGNDIDGYLLLPGHNHPIQYLTNKYLSKVWPYCTSLEEPLKDRAVKKICLWASAGSMTEEMEVEAIKSVFFDTDILVEYYSSNKTNLNKFREIYQSDQYDVIWVMSHGEYDHWDVGDVKIRIGENQFISLEEAINFQVPNKGFRRLLILNVCDGATHAHTGGLAKIGFAPALSNKNQCVISHLWPVNPYSAAFFGVVMSIMIRNGYSFFDAYQKSLLIFSQGNQEILDLLYQFDGLSNMRDRLVNQNIDCSLMIHAGSSAFFQ